MIASDDVQAADWIRDRLHPFAQDVGSVVPTGFDAYARIFHPAWRRGDGDQIEVRWSEVAAWSGRAVHPEMQFHSIAVPAPGRQSGPAPWSFGPRLGVLPVRLVGAMVGMLARHTSTPDSCWFCLWDGYGYLTGGHAVAYLFAGKTGVSRPSVTPPPPTLKKGRV